MGALLAPISTATELAQLIPSYVPLASPWIAVRQRFDQLNQNISLTFLQKVDGRTKLNGVLNCLNQSYYNLPSGEANSLLIGSWGKGDDGRPLVEASGVDRKLAEIWRDQLKHIDEELLMWGRTFQRRYRSTAQSAELPVHADEDSADNQEVDVYADAENWDESVSANG
jgi:hypothetical protein